MLLIASISVLNSAEYKVPKGWYLKEHSFNDSVKIYKKKSSAFYVVAVDMKKARIKVGSHFQRTKKNGRNYFSKESIIAHHDKNRDYIDTYYGTYKNLVATLNSQFFNKNTDPSALPFPLKSNGIKLYDKDDEPHLKKRSLIITRSGRAYIKNGFTESWFRRSYFQEFLVGLHPDVNKKPFWNIGRHYIGGIPKGRCNPDKRTCSYEYLLFFVKKYARQAYMERAIKQWNVKSSAMIMMDGSGSAQLKTDKIEMYGSTTGSLSADERDLPITLSIYAK